jgi:competence protein ComEC
VSDARVNSIGLITAWIAGCGIGLLVVGRRPDGLDAKYGAALLVLALLALLLAALARREKWVACSCLFVVAALAGCGRAILIHPPITPATLSFYNTPEEGPPVTVVGRVVEDSVILDRLQRVRIGAEELRRAHSPEGITVSGQALAILPRYPHFEPGEILILTGTLTSPPRLEGFDYPAYLGRSGIYSYLSFPRVSRASPDGGGKARDLGWEARGTNLVRGLREGMRTTLQRYVPEPQAALAVGVVIGDRTSLPDAVREDFQRSGTSHVLAISGQNIALILGFVWLLYAGRSEMHRMPGWLAGALIVAIAIYAGFTGGAPSVVRAAAMAVIVLMGPLVGRRYDPIAALAVCALCMTMVDPDVLADVGFQLSFGAMLGIALLGPGLSKFLLGLRFPRYLGLALACSLAAQVTTTPIMAFAIGNVSLVGPLATLFVDVALFPLMVSGFLTGIVSVFAPPLGAMFALAVWACAAWMVGWAHFWSTLPSSSLSVGPLHPIWLPAYYGALAFALWLGTLDRPQRPAAAGVSVPDRRRGLRVLAGLAACLFAVAVSLLFGT